MNAHHRISILLFVAIVVGCASFADAQHSEQESNVRITPQPGAPKPAEIPNLKQVTRLLAKQTNKFREGQKLVTLNGDKKLNKTARVYARYMAKEGKCGHTVDGRTPSQRVKAQEYEYCIVAENVACHFSSKSMSADELATALLTGWKESPGHRKNLVDPDVREVGFGVVYSEDDGYFYAVQLFARPESARIEIRLANRTPAEVEYEINGEIQKLPEGVTRTHYRCRPTKLAMPASDNEKIARQTLLIGESANYEVIRDTAGKLQLRREAASDGGSTSADQPTEK